MFDRLSDLFKSITVEGMLYFFVALTFLVLPIGSAPPLISLVIALAVWVFSGTVFRMKNVVKMYWVIPLVLLSVLPWIGLLKSKDLELGMDYALKTKYIPISFLVAGLWLSSKKIETLLRLFWIGLLSGAFLAALQFAGVMPPVRERFLGFGIVHTQLSLYLVIGLFTLSFAFRNEVNVKKRVITGFAMLTLFFHLVVLEGRAGYLILALLTPFIANNLMLNSSKLIKFFIFILIVSSLALSPVVRNEISKTIKQIKKRQVITQGKLDTGFMRPFMAHTAMELIKKSPMTGVGTGSFRHYSKQSKRMFSHPHNNILHLGVSYGVIGILSYFWLFGNMLVLSWRKMGTQLGNFVFAISIVLFLGGFFDTNILNTGTLLLLMIGYGLVRHIDSKPDMQNNITTSPRLNSQA